MVSTRKRNQQNRKLFSQLSERDTDFMIGKSNQDEQTENRDNMLRRCTSRDKASNPAQIILFAQLSHKFLFEFAQVFNMDFISNLDQQREVRHFEFLISWRFDHNNVDHKSFSFHFTA